MPPPPVGQQHDEPVGEVRHEERGELGEHARSSRERLEHVAGAGEQVHPGAGPFRLRPGRLRLGAGPFRLLARRLCLGAGPLGLGPRRPLGLVQPGALLLGGDALGDVPDQDGEGDGPALLVPHRVDALPPVPPDAAGLAGKPANSISGSGSPVRSTLRKGSPATAARCGQHVGDPQAEVLGHGQPVDLCQPLVQGQVAQVGVQQGETHRGLGHQGVEDLPRHVRRRWTARPRGCSRAPRPPASAGSTQEHAR